MTDSSDRVITIDARVAKECKSDLFRVSIYFEGDDSEKEECVRAFNEDQARVLSALEEAGIPADRIKSASFNVTRHYDWYYEKCSDHPKNYHRRTERFISGHEYSGDCSFEHEFDHGMLAAVWDVLQRTEGSFSFDITYSLEHPDACERELLQSAVVEARSRANTLTAAAGAELGEVASISHAFRHASSDFSESVKLSAGAIADDGPCAPDLNPESMPVRCEVSISWFIV